MKTTNNKIISTSSTIAATTNTNTRKLYCVLPPQGAIPCNIKSYTDNFSTIVNLNEIRDKYDRIIGSSLRQSEKRKTVINEIIEKLRKNDEDIPIYQVTKKIKKGEDIDINNDLEEVNEDVLIKKIQKRLRNARRNVTKEIFLVNYAISKQDMERCEKLLKTIKTDPVVIKTDIAGAHSMSHHVLEKLIPPNWISDEFVNIVMIFLNDYCFREKMYLSKPITICANSFWYSKFKEFNGRMDVKISSRKGKMIMKDLAKRYFDKLLEDAPPDFKSFHIRSIIFPINVDNTHWVMCLVDTKNYTIDYYDPFHGSNSDTTVTVSNSQVNVIGDIVTCLFCEGDKEKFRFLWKITQFPCDAYLPIQKDQYNCAMYTCLVAYYKVHDMEFGNKENYEKKLKHIDCLRLEFLAVIMSRAVEIVSDLCDDSDKVDDDDDDSVQYISPNEMEVKNKDKN